MQRRFISSLLLIAIFTFTVAEWPIRAERNIQLKDNPYKYNVNGVAFEMVPVKGGKFKMGSDDIEAPDAEKPLHEEYVGDFLIAKTAVTQALWQAVMGENPSLYKGDDRPVECVSWNDCQMFLNKLNSLTGKNFRLPTEVEWEYAAKGGGKSRGYSYSGGNDIDDVAWYASNSDFETHPVGKKKANELGIYDMSGNVFEWTSDKWRSDYNSPCNGGSESEFRVIRGGSYGIDPSGCKSSTRGNRRETRGADFVGLRLAL